MMPKLVLLALRNAVRNGRRTVLTTMTVAIGTAFTVLMLAFMSGIFDGLMEDWQSAFGPIRVVTTEYAEKEALQPLYANIEQSDPVIAKISAVEGVLEAAPVIRTGVLVAVGEELGEDPASLVSSTDDWFKRHVLPGSSFASGGWLAEKPDHEQVVLGARVARDISAKVGDRILVMGTTQYGSMAPISADVVGIITGNSSVDAQAYVTLETARWMIDVPDGALEIAVYGAESSDRGVAALSERLRTALGEGYLVEPWYARAIWAQSAPLMRWMKAILSGVVIVVMALAIFNTMTMSVLERTGEIGVMRAMGQSRASAVGLFMVEAVVIGLGGGALGAALGAIPALYLQVNGVSYAQDLLDEVGETYPMASTLYAQLTPEILLIALVVGVGTACLGALLPSLRAAGVQPSEAMRARR